MSNLNTILNKLGKIEEIEKTNLAKHEIELALIDDIKKLQVTANNNEDKALNELKKGISILENASKLYLTSRDSANLVIKEIDKARLMSKELGIQLPNNIEALFNYYSKTIGENFKMSNKITQFTKNALNG